MRIIQIFILIFITLSCSSLSSRSPSSADLARDCFDSLHNLVLITNDHEEKVARIIAHKQASGEELHLDLGGEGRYEDAININPQPYTSTTGEPGREIPYWVKGRTDEIPFPDQSVDQVTVENAPINQDGIKEILRVMRPRGKIRLSHPKDYGQRIHQLIISEYPNARVSQIEEEINLTTIINFE
jgi:SAM-dependent methyltransferase